MKKKLLSLLLVVIIVLGMLPGMALAATSLQGDTNKNGTVDVVLTISEGTDDFYTTANDNQLFAQELNVPYFDLALYGLEHYYYNPNCYAGGAQQPGTKITANGVVTTMHVFIWATELYVIGADEKDCGKGNFDISPYISWTQGAGSSFMKFWNGSANLNYFLDYQFPLGREGWGSTSDQQALHDGSKIDVHLIIDEDVTGSSYSFFETEDGTKDAGEMTEGESIDLTLRRTTSSYNVSESFPTVANCNVYYILKDEYAGEKITSSAWTNMGITDENGKITVPSDLAPGVYYISCQGEVGSSERGPAAFILTVNKDYSDGKPGDADEDGYVTSKDATLVLQKAAEIDVEINTVSADVDGDGFVTSKDASYILQYAAEIITSFPVETNS